MWEDETSSVLSFWFHQRVLFHSLSLYIHLSLSDIRYMLPSMRAQQQDPLLDALSPALTASQSCCRCMYGSVTSFDGAQHPPPAGFHPISIGTGG